MLTVAGAIVAAGRRDAALVPAHATAGRRGGGSQLGLRRGPFGCGPFGGPLGRDPLGERLVGGLPLGEVTHDGRGEEQ